MKQNYKVVYEQTITFVIKFSLNHISYISQFKLELKVNYSLLIVYFLVCLDAQSLSPNKKRYNVAEHAL